MIATPLSAEFCGGYHTFQKIHLHEKGVERERKKANDKKMFRLRLKRLSSFFHTRFIVYINEY